MKGNTKKNRRIGSRLLSIMMAVVLCVGMIPVTGFAAGTSAGSRTLKLAILSDVHYVSPSEVPAEGTEARANFNHAEQCELRLGSEIDSILNQALKDAVATQPDAMLFSGDLSSDGEYVNNEALAEKLKTVKTQMKDGAGIYVLNGNHDINNSYAADFKTVPISNAKRTQVSDFKKLYKDFGYGGGSNYRYYNVEPGKEAKNYGSLSYATEISDGVTLIAMDAGVYSNDEEARYNDAQQTGGTVSDGLLRWAETEAKTAVSKGNVVLVMCHYAVLNHYSETTNTYNLYKNAMQLSNWEEVAQTMADAGAAAFLTGHGHVSDIAEYVSKAGNKIYEIQTPSLSAYPCGWRTIDITINNGTDKNTYDFNVDTHFIEKVDGLIGDGKTLTYQDKEYDNLQSYSFVKSGINKESIIAIGEYGLRSFLWQIKSSKKGNHQGLDAYLRNELDIPDNQDVGTFVTEQVKSAIPEGDKSKNGLIVDTNVPVVNVAVQLLRDAQAKKRETAEKVVVHLFLGNRSEDTGEIVDSSEGFVSLDLAKLPEAINTMIEEVNRDMEDDTAWTTNYGTIELQEEIKNLVANALLPPLTEKLDPEDDRSSALQILNDAYQSCALGDENNCVPIPYQEEGWTLDQLREKRSHWWDLITGDAIVTKAKTSIINEVLSLAGETNDKYPQLNSLTHVVLCSDPKIGLIGLEEVLPEGADPEENTMLQTIYSLAFEGLSSLDVILTELSDLGIASTILPNSLFADLLKGYTDFIIPMATDSRGIPAAKFSFQVTVKIPQTPTPTPAPAPKPDNSTSSALGKGSTYAKANEALLKVTGDKDPADTVYNVLRFKSSKQTKNSIKLTWAASKDAKRYVIYGSLSGKKKKLKQLASVKKTNYNVKKVGSKLKKGTYYNFVLLALDKNDKVISTSKAIHAATKGGKVTNAKKVTAKVKKGKKYKAVKKASIKAGKTLKLKAVVTKQGKGKIRKFDGVRYESTNTAVATVTSKGKIKAKKAGKCNVYVIAQNGVSTTVKVTVKK